MTVIVIGAVLSLSFWASLYCFLCGVNGSRSYEWNCRLVTLLHGILAVCITAYIGYVDGPWPFSYPGEDRRLNSEEQTVNWGQLQMQEKVVVAPLLIWCCSCRY